MRRLLAGSFLLPFLSAALVLSLTALSAEGDSDIHYIDDDWRMFEHNVTLRNGTWWVNGTVVMDYHTLRLENATLVIDNGERSTLVLRNKAFLSCRNSTVRGTDHGVSIHITQHGILENSTFYHDDQVHRDTQLHHYAGNLTVLNCTFAKGYWLFRSYSNLTMRNCTFFNTSYWSVAVGYYDHYRYPCSVLIENCSFQSNTGYYGGTGIVATGPGDSDVPCDVTVRNCTMRQMHASLSAYNFKDNGTLLLENNIAVGCSGGTKLEDAGGAVTLRHNRWEAVGVPKTALTIEITGKSPPVVHNETIISRYTGIGVRGRPSTHLVLYDLTILNANVGISVRDLTVEVRNCNLSCRWYDFRASCGRILIYDCNHTYHGIVSALLGNITELNPHRFTSVSWQGEVPIEEGTIVFLNLSGEVVARLDHPNETSVEIPSWFMNRTYEGRYTHVTGTFSPSGVPFESEPFPTKGPSVMDLVIIDDFTPVLAVDSPVPGERIRGNSIVVSGNVTEHGSGLVCVDARLSGGEWVTALERRDGYWTVILSTLEDSTHAIEVRARDLTGNEATILVPDIHTDTTPPSIDLLEPDLFTNKVRPLLVMRIEPDAEVHVNDILVEVDGEGVCRVPIHLLEGRNSYQVWAVDTVGNENSTTIIINRDTRIPVLTLDQPVDGEWIPRTVFVVAGATEVDAIVFVNGEEADRDGGAFSILIEAEEGPLSIRVTAIDRAGNVGVVTLEVTLDLTPPLLHVDPFETGEVTSHPDLRISGWADDAGPVFVLVNGGTVSDFDHSFNHTYRLEEGPNRIIIKAVDAAGNSALVVRQVSLDTAPPRVTATLIIGDDSYREGSRRILTNATVVTLVLEADEECTVDIAGQGWFRLAKGCTEIDIDLNENGHMTLALEAVDKVGNSVAKVLFVVDCDTRPPELTIQRPASGSTLTLGKVTIAGSTEAGAMVEINGFPVPVDEQGLFNIEHELVEGRNTLLVSSRDAAGNVAMEELRLVFEPEGGPCVVFAVVGGIAIAVLASLLFLRHRLRGGQALPPEEDWVEVP